MTNFHQLEKLCHQQSELSAACIDNFLLNYAAEKDTVDIEFDRIISRHQKAVKQLPKSWEGMARAQYMSHRIFRQEGLIHKYLKHAAIKSLPPGQVRFFQEQSGTPWVFRFCAITSRPSKDFFQMADVFSYEDFLLYSPSLTQTLAEQPVQLCLLLTGFNGECWQTYGPLVTFTSFDADDIFFFGTEQEPEILTDEDLIKAVDKNPVPFMLLITGSNFPQVHQQGHEIVYLSGDDFVPFLDISALEEFVHIEYSSPVFKLTAPSCNQPPHFAAGYYHEDKCQFTMTAMTDFGYDELQKILTRAGMEIDENPSLRIHLPLIGLVKDILHKTVAVTPYEKLFEPQMNSLDDNLLEKLNQAMMLALPDINAGREPDIEALSKKVGVDVKTLREILQVSMKQIGKMKKKL